MERLTEKHYNGQGYYLLCSGVLRCDNKCDGCAELEKAIDRLGELEDAAEQETAPVVHGRWINPYMNRYGHPCHCCSVCGFKASYQDKNYCPNCGAKMDGGAEDGRKAAD